MNITNEDSTAEKNQNLFIVKLNFVDGVTLFGAALSCYSIAQILQGNFALSLAVLCLAVIADAFDGILARKFNLERDFGRYLDGFVDTLMYLVAPAIFLHSWGFNSSLESFLLVVFFACGIIRLSVFNETGNIVNKNSGLGYLGAPVFWSALVLPVLYICHYLVGSDSIKNLLILVLPLFSMAMLHNRHYYKFKNPIVMLVGLLSISATMFLLHFYEGNPINILLNDIKVQLLTAAMCIFPIMLAGIVHMVVVKKDWLSFLALPIHSARLGRSKTWRGFVVMPAVTIVGFYAMFFALPPQQTITTIDFSLYSPWVCGLVLGLSYTFAELPNSALKRYLGAEPGSLPDKNRIFFLLLDQLDSILGCCIAYSLLFNVPAFTLCVIIGLAVITTLVTKFLLFQLGYKKTGR